jgi:hypothetical protein
MQGDREPEAGLTNHRIADWWRGKKVNDRTRGDWAWIID